MRSTRSGFPRAAIVATLVVASPAYAAVVERPSPVMPERTTQVLALSDGGALLLGGDQLVRVKPDGSVHVEPHPEIGLRLHASLLGEETWLLGRKGLLHRQGEADWTLHELPSNLRCEPLEHHQVIPLRPQQAAVLCTGLDENRAPTAAVVLVDARKGFGERSLFPGIFLGPSAADGRGGLWAVARGLTSVYAHFSNDHWTIWRTAVAPTIPGMTTELAKNRMRESRNLVADGKGGVYTAGGDHIDSEGVLRDAKLNPKGGWNNVVAMDARSGRVLVAENFGSDQFDSPNRRLLVIEGEGTIARAEPLPVPPALEAYTGFDIVSMSVAADRIWLATGLKVMSRTGEDWTVYWSPAAVKVTPEYLARRRREERLEGFFTYAGPVAGAAAAVAGGGYLASRLEGERYLVASGEVAAGTVMAAISVAGIGGEEVLMSGPFGCFSRSKTAGLWCIFFLGQTGVTSLVAGGGTWAAAGALEGGVPSGGALAGSIAGALVGSLTASIVGQLVPLPESLRLGFLSGLIGTGATFGYQLAH